LLREKWALQRAGEESEPAVADVDRDEYREAVFGQTCPIETAVDKPATIRIMMPTMGNKPSRASN
jgi:hypothetical protein